jgi:mycothiol synthase
MFQPKMSNPTYIIRNYHTQDFDKLVQLAGEVQDLGQTWCLISPLDLIESVGQPIHSFDNNLFVVENAGEVVGFADVKQELNIGRVVLSFLIHPKHRRKGLPAKLIECGIGHTRELGVRIVHINILQECVTGKRLLNKMGFRFVRRFLELRLDLPKTLLPDISKMAPLFRHLECGEEDRLTEIQNRSFADSWGYNTNTLEEVIYRTSLPNFSPEDIILAWDAEKPIGYCWTRINFWKNKSTSESHGRIYMLGVDPDHRGRGIGKQVLLAGLSYLKSRGLRVVELTVDHKNKTACALYSSVGFKLWTSTLWYEKKLDEACDGSSVGNFVKPWPPVSL